VDTEPVSFIKFILFQLDLQQHAPLRQCCSSLSNPQGSPTCTIHPVTISMMTTILLLLRHQSKQPSSSQVHVQLTCSSGTPLHCFVLHVRLSLHTLLRLAPPLPSSFSALQVQASRSNANSWPPLMCRCAAYGASAYDLKANSSSTGQCQPPTYPSPSIYLHTTLQRPAL
jgi:hypothetical protein